MEEEWAEILNKDVSQHDKLEAKASSSLGVPGGEGHRTSPRTSMHEDAKSSTSPLLSELGMATRAEIQCLTLHRSAACHGSGRYNLLPCVYSLDHAAATRQGDGQLSVVCRHLAWSTVCTSSHFHGKWL